MRELKRGQYISFTGYRRRWIRPARCRTDGYLHVDSSGQAVPIPPDDLAVALASLRDFLLAEEQGQCPACHKPLVEPEEVWRV